MERKRNAFRKRHSIVQRVFSFVLVVAMMLTLIQALPGGGISAEAAEGTYSVGAKITEGDDAEKYPVTFTYTSDTKLSSCALAGAMNNWGDLAMEDPNKDDADKAGYTWTTTMNLSAGSYKYKFKPNGDWESGDNRTANVGGTATEKVDVGDETATGSGVYNVTFTYTAADTLSKCTVAGDFNNWGNDASGATELKQTSDNVWSVTLQLATGKYKYQFKPNDEYTGKDNSEITVGNYVEPEAANIFVLAGANELIGWNEGPTDSNTLVKGSDNKYSITVQSVPAGTWEYCILQDPNNKGWDMKWGGSNLWVTVASLSDVTFTIDITDTTYAVQVDQTPVTTSVVSPVINDDGTITFNLDATGKYADVENINLESDFAGCGWDPGIQMKKNTEKGVWTVTIPAQTPGVYGYKFRVGAADKRADSDTWLTDPVNSTTTTDGNSKLVIAGLANGTVTVARGKSAELPKTLNLYGEDGSTSEVEVSYVLKDTSLANDVTISNDGKITVAAGTTITSVVLTATYENYTSEVTVNVEDKVYTYNVYFFDWTAEHMSTSAAGLWAWEKDGANLNDNQPIKFSSLEELSDGHQWLKATITTSATTIGLIPRSYDDWNWQTTDHYFTNKSGAESCDIYIVMGDSKTYSELPELKEPRERYVVVEYQREDEDYTDWNIYSWNTGVSSSNKKSMLLEKVNGKNYITVPIQDSYVDFNLSFCMRRSTADDEWAEKDGGDHYITVPADQTVVKAKFVEGKGVTEVLPYNVGYEMDGKNDQIHFYYRDDNLFLTNELDTLVGKVQVVVNGNTYNMQYDAENERFYYDYKQTSLEAGDYEYHYIVDGEQVLDKFNSRVNNAGDNSVLTFKRYNLGIEASVLNEEMDYNDNNVLTVSFTGTDAEKITDDEIADIQVDCEELGVGTYTVDTELKQVSIACLYSTTTGKKTLPVTVKDIYGFEYTTEATVTVTEREKTDGDFDWDEAVIYFAVTDRFFDGNTNNDEGVNKDGSLSYHGGDFAGLNQKLDELQELGVNTIWITPIVENSDTTTEKDGETIESTGYHGYWASDFTKLNSHLGSEEEFAALVEAVHDRGMKIMVDVVINHAGYNTEEYFNSLNENMTMIRDDENTVADSDVYASLSGLPDFVTEDAAVRAQLIEWQTNWMSKYAIDYYRVDTVKHVDETTWSAFKNALTTINPDFKMTGEYSGAGYASNAGELGTGRMDALLDFDFNDFAENFVTGNIESVEKSLVTRNGALNNTSTMSSFINSHDENGLQAKLQDNEGLTEEQARNLMKVAASLTITAKGQPVIYYGEELGLYGKDNYPYQTNRYDYDWDELEVQKADGNSIYNHYKTMLAIRNAYTDVFARGTRTTIETSDTDGYDVFTRSYDGTTLYVGMNIKSEAQTVSITVEGNAGEYYMDLYSGNTYTLSEDGKLSVTIPAANDGGTVVLIKGEGEKAPVFTETTNPENNVNNASISSEVNVKTFTSIEERQEMAEKGKDLSVWLEEKEATPSDEDKKLLEAAKPENYSHGIYLDFSLWKQFDGEEAELITETDGAITITFDLPEALVNTDATKTRTYKMIRIHDDETKVLDCSYDAANNKISFATDKFSVYELVYIDEAKKKPSNSQSDKTTQTSTGSTDTAVNAGSGSTVGANTTNTANTAPTSADTSDNAPWAGYVMVLLFGGVFAAEAVRRKRGQIG